MAEKGSNKRKFTVLIGVIALFVVLVVALAAVIRQSYQSNLRAVSSVSKTHVVTINPGATTTEVADNLKTKGAIRSDWAFEWYVRNNQLHDELKAGTYVINENQNVSEIVNILTSGKVATDLVTIVPGKRLDQVKQAFIESGFTAEQVEQALEPTQYAGHPALTDKPEGATLEGYLYPESFQKTAETTLKDIVALSLDEMQFRLTPEVRQAISKQGLTLHQGLILTSIVEREVSNPEDRAQVAQVFYKRINEGIRLQSNATDDYSKLDPKYNTYEIEGLPPGPVSNVTDSSLQAVAFPAQTDWLYFVSGDDKKTHFSKTLAEHEELIKRYCTTLCGR